VAQILATSEAAWGPAARRRYETALVAAMRIVADEPEGPATRLRSDIARGIRSFHLRYAKIHDPNMRVRRPVHILYYRIVAASVIEIVRVLHERMEPSRHLPWKR
jgi:toxin ParE1/3/4